MMCPVLACILDVEGNMAADSSAKVRNITIEKEQGGVVQLAHIPLQTPHGVQTETRELSMTILFVDVESSIASL